MALNIKPLADRVVVEAAAAEEKSSGGIILPDTAQEKILDVIDDTKSKYSGLHVMERE